MRARTSDFSLAPFQKEGARFLVHRRYALLADDMGLGKTRQAIAAAMAINTPALRVLVVAPASVTAVWARELDQMGVAPDRVRRPKKAKDVPFELRQLAGGGWLIVSWDVLRAQHRHLERRWSALVLDEAHYLRNVSVHRAKAAEAVSRVAKRTWLLTGTPLVNHADDLLMPARLLRMDIAKDVSLTRWRETWCVLDYETIFVRGGIRRLITRVIGSQRMGELRREFAPQMLRRRKADVLPNLPALTWQRLALDIDCDELPDLSDDEADDVLAWIRDNDGPPPASSSVVTLRRLLAERKATALLPIIADHLANPKLGSLVIFGWFRSALETIAKAFNTVPLTGSTTQAARARMVDDFQAGRSRLFIGNIQAAGTGITLTRANRLMFVELWWTPAANMQARDRLHRIGQTLPVLACHVDTNHPLDQRINDILAAKLVGIQRFTPS